MDRIKMPKRVVEFKFKGRRPIVAAILEAPPAPILCCTLVGCKITCDCWKFIF
jgi:hypothetical protein